MPTTLVETGRSQVLSRVLDRIMGHSGKQRLSILIYHRVLSSADYMRPGDPTVDRFDWQMALLAKHFCPLPLADALTMTEQGRLPDRAVCVTFDDGYADNARLALPILQKWQIPATVFVSTAFLDGGRMWNDTVLEAIRSTEGSAIDLTDFNLGKFRVNDEESRRLAAHTILKKIKHLPNANRQAVVELVAQFSSRLPDNLMLSTSELLELRESGIEIGAHTHSHPILAMLEPDAARNEILHNKRLLERTLGRTVRFFAYPNGKPGDDYGPAHIEMVRELGFDAGLSTRLGVANWKTDRWQLPRFTPWDARPGHFMLRLLHNQRNVL